MQGYQLTFFTQQDRKHQGKPLAQWLIDEARAMGVGGATLVPATESFGHHRRIHSVHFIELANQPVEVIMAVTVDEAKRLFERLGTERIKLFYIKTPVEYGTTDEEG